MRRVRFWRQQLCLVGSFWYQTFKATSDQSVRKDPTSRTALSSSHRKSLSRERGAIPVLEQLVPSLPSSLEDPLHSASQPAAPRLRKIGANLGVKVEFSPLRPAAFGLRMGG